MIIIVWVVLGWCRCALKEFHLISCQFLCKSNSEEKPLNDPNSEEGFEEFLKKMEQERQEKDRGRPPKLFNMNSHV